MATSLQLISTTTASGSSTVSVTDCFTSEYDNYVINIEDMIFASRNSINMRLINSSGVQSTSKYDRAVLQLRNDSSFTQSRNSDQTSFVTVAASSGGSDEFGGVWIEIFNPNISSAFTFLTMQHSAYYDTVNGDLLGYKYIGAYKVEEANTGFQLIHAGGFSFDPIKVNVFGVL